MVRQMKMWLALASLLAVPFAWAGATVDTPSPAAQARPAAAPAIKLYVFDGGTLESDPGRYQMTKEDVGGVTQLSVAAYLIVHPRGVLMWDAGAVGDSEWKPTGGAVQHRLTLPDGQPRTVTLSKPLLSQLTAAGYSPASVTHFALSHYHWDHTANASAFAKATWLVRKVERDTMFADLPPGTYRKDTYSALRDAKTVIINDAEYDVFGDRSVIVKSAPGHTVGHQVLYVKLPKTGGVVLSGDLYHYPQERTLGKMPTFEFSETQTRASRREVDEFLKKNNAQLWIQHDFTATAKQKKAPEFYD